MAFLVPTINLGFVSLPTAELPPGESSVTQGEDHYQPGASSPAQQSGQTRQGF